VRAEVDVTEAGNALGVNKDFRQVLKAPGPRARTSTLQDSMNNLGLARVIAAWPQLADHVRRAILTLADG
jgi:hypothetical protein